jgi:hypothetical protein
MGEVAPPNYTFVIDGVVPGTYVVTAEPDESNLLGRQEVVVVDRHVDGVVVTMRAGGDLPGTIKVSNTDPPPDLSSVRVILSSDGIYSNPSGTEVAADGSFTQKNVSPARFKVTIENIPENCYVGSIRYDGQEISESGAEWVAGQSLDIVLMPTAAQVTGGVVDKDGRPVAGAIVALIGKDGVRSAIADAAGQYRFAGLKPGDYQLIAWEDIDPASLLDPEVIKPFESRAESVTLAPSARQTVPLQAIPERQP